MIKIGLLSDTHGYFNPELIKFFKDVDEIWHAGDIGSNVVVEEIRQLKPLQAVYGNIDNHDIRREFKQDLRFNCEDVDVLITHIGGYPGRYEKRIKQILDVKSPKLFISGHSHILKVMNDKRYNLLHINPGAAGKFGFQKVSTAVRFAIDKDKIMNLEIVEL